MEAKAGFFYFREIFGMVTSVLTIGTTAPIIIFMYLENPTILNDLETSCSLKGTFALFCLSATIEVFLILVKSSCFALTIACKGRCRINCYHLVVLLHFTSCMFLFIGIVIYAAKLDANIWYWNTTTVAALLALVNSFATCIFQREYRSLRREETRDSGLAKGIRDLTGSTETRGLQDFDLGGENENLLSHKAMGTGHDTGLPFLKESPLGIKMQTLSGKNKKFAFK